MIIDCHTHLGIHNGKNFKPEDILSSMDKAGIDYSLVIADSLGDEGLGMDEAIETTQGHNRLKVIGNVDFDTLGKEQINKLTLYLRSKKIYGIKFYLGYEQFYASNDKIAPLYKFCSDNNYPVIYHTGVLEVGYKGLLKYSHPLTIDEVANKFPKLKIVIAHMGNPWIMDAAAVILKNENVYMDFSGFFDEYEDIKKDQVDYFLKRMWEFKQFTGNFKKCLFGTDYPLYYQKQYLNSVLKLRFTKEEKDLVLWQNANKIFNLGL